MARTPNEGRKVLARNRKATHEYHIAETYEAGIVLRGPEVKSVRAGKASLAEAFARVEGGEVWIHAMHISPYDPASRENADPVRPRKLLLHRREIDRLTGAVDRRGYTVVPTAMYWSRGKVKVEVGLAKGKQQHDKRKTQKDRDWERQKARIMKRG